MTVKQEIHVRCNYEGCGSGARYQRGDRLPKGWIGLFTNAVSVLVSAAFPDYHYCPSHAPVVTSKPKPAGGMVVSIAQCTSEDRVREIVSEAFSELAKQVAATGR